MRVEAGTAPLVVARPSSQRCVNETGQDRSRSGLSVPDRQSTTRMRKPAGVDSEESTSTPVLRPCRTALVDQVVDEPP